MGRNIRKTQKIDLVPYTKKDMYTFYVFAVCVVLLSLFADLADNQWAFFDFPIMLILLPISILAFWLFYRFRLAKKPLPNKLEYDLVEQKFIIHHKNARTFPPIIIHFNDIEKLSYTWKDVHRGITTIVFNLATVNGENFLLYSHCCFDSQYANFIAPLEVFEKSFETKFQNFPECLLSEIDKYKHDGKFPLLDNECRKMVVVVVLVAIVLVVNLIRLFISYS